ncbi:MULTISPECIES: caspase family protein [unclassified Anaeromyxobacter]|uniref:caspase family protein n=1 Tax=unclassified Anaeromyxobacter TaxID=2620896 RepID=UPI001F59B587|nr:MULTISPECIES: caspase family protein [unclassified Anaeromyxobacter]
MIRPVLALAAVLLAGAAAAQGPSRAEPPGAVRRLALVAGANDGGPARPRLRYAISDAERVARVLQQMGGVAGEDTIVLLDPGEASLRAALEELRSRVRRARAGGRTEVLFYYSGHSDEEGLLLRGARVPYGELRRWLTELGADIRIAILDSCSSGSFTRGKGGARAAPFLVDASSRVSGQVILTSSSADEASQESDRVGASFFTHALVTGLRGAADASQDGKVTLSEVYQFAFDETLARTERTRGGPQHAVWDIQLVGAGEVVLTDLRGSGATLVLPAAAAGRFFVRDSGERLVAELRKHPGRPLELALDPGGYRVSREEDGRLVEARVALTQGGRTELAGAGFAAVPRELTALRGDGVEELARVPVDLSIFPPVSFNGDRYVVNRLQLGLIASRTTRLRGIGLAPVLWADEDVVGGFFSYIGSSARGRVTGVQVGMVANVAGSLRGVQLTQGLNLVRGDVVGWQHSSVSWAAGAVTGLQSALVGYAGSVSGAQLALASVSGEVHGAQIGLVNVGSGVRGVQVGLVNVGGHVRGAQLGLVNVADGLDGVSLGLLPIVRGGEHKLLVLGDENGILSAGLLLGSRAFHTILSAGAQRADSGGRLWSGFGLGAHQARGRFLLDVDLLSQQAVDAGANVLATARVLAGWQVTRSVAVVAGPSASLFWAEEGFRPGLGGLLEHDLGADGGRRAWLGFAAGLRLGPP